MLRRILSLFVLPALVSAGTIVQTGTLRDDNVSLVSAFDLPGYHLIGVEMTIESYVDWEYEYSFSGGSAGVPLNPPARVTTTTYQRIELTLPGGGFLSTPETVCQELIPETGIGYGYCFGGLSTLSWSGDPGDPAWTGDWLLSVGYAVPIGDAQCQPGLPAIHCSAGQTMRPFPGASYTLTYSYVEDFPPEPNPVPEPTSAVLVLLPLAAGVYAVRRRV